MRIAWLDLLSCAAVANRDGALLSVFAPYALVLGLFLRGCRGGGPTAAHRVAEGLKWFANQLSLSLPLKSPMTIEQAAIPGDHIEEQETALTLPQLAQRHSETR